MKAQTSARPLMINATSSGNFSPNSKQQNSSGEEETIKQMMQKVAALSTIVENT